jgi:phosphoenolpyruvate-protein kinase (PTS system EI component)
MAETPAAALALAETLEAADFVALGCNDLMQCFFGVDRELLEVSRFLDPCAPPLLRFLRQAAEAAGDAVGEVQLCGLLPQAPGILPVLLGLGYRVFSVEPVAIPYLARTIGAVRIDSAESLAAAACAAPDATSVRRLLGLPRDSTWGIGALALPPDPGPGPGGAPL